MAKTNKDFAMDIEVLEFPKDSLKSKLNQNTKSLSLTARDFLFTAICDCTN